MSTRNGSITITIEDKPRTFTFGLACWHELCVLQNLPLSKISQALDSNSPGFLSAIGDLVYAAAKCYCEINGLEVDFSRYQAWEWVNEMSQQDFNALMDCMQQSKLLGNQLGLAARTVAAVAQTQPQKKTL